MYLPGQSGGRACANLLFGRANPSGRLAETYPLTYADVPFGSDFGKGINEVYKEGVFVGYRYYTTANVKVRYPFGYGLSYTNFEYQCPSVRRQGNKITVKTIVKNAGSRYGGEVVQVYAGLNGSAIFRPQRQLVAFKKVYLQPGESVAVTLEVDIADLAVWNMAKDGWGVEGGTYTIELCKDALTPIYAVNIAVEGEDMSNTYTPEAMAVYGGAQLEKVTDKLFEGMSEQKIPALPPAQPVSLESRFTDLKLIQSAFEEKVLGALPESVLKSLCEKYQAEKEATERKIAELESRLAEADSVGAEVEEYIARLKRYARCEELTREMCLQLIEFITVGEKDEGRHAARDPYLLQIHLERACGLPRADEQTNPISHRPHRSYGAGNIRRRKRAG